MAYTLNTYFSSGLINSQTPRVLVYPNNDLAAQIVSQFGNTVTVIRISDCIFDNDTRLPMPNTIMSTIDAKIRESLNRALVVGIDSYLALLDTNGISAFMSELCSRLDAKELNVNYLLSKSNNPEFLPRYKEGRLVVYFDGEDNSLEPLSIQAYSDKWVKSVTACSYKQLLEQMGSYEPYGDYTLVLSGLTERQVGINNVVSFITDIHEVAAKYYEFNVDLEDDVLSQLLIKSSENGLSAQEYLKKQFGVDNINIRLALKRLRELRDSELWSAYIWMLRQQLPNNSYIFKVISDDINCDNLLWKYIVGSAVSAISDTNAKKYATERAEALKTIDGNYESLIVEFIGNTKDLKAALPFLNCGTNAERVEIVRRASKEELSYGLPKIYKQLLPSLVDYLYCDFDFGNVVISEYFKEYRRLKVSGNITDAFVERAFNLSGTQNYPSRDEVLTELQTQPDIALLVVDAMGVEYMPLLLALAKHLGMNIESQAVVMAKLPTETKFNPIEWNETRRLKGIKSVDNTVHDGVEKHEISLPEENLAKTLLTFETRIITAISEGLNRFPRVVVTADHGASRLAVIAHNEKKSIDIPWNGKPNDWRFTLAPQGESRPPELEQAYVPKDNETYWVVRGYNRLPKQGGKIYELHGGATLEERLVPLVVFTRNVVTASDQLTKKSSDELLDEFEGLI